MNWRHGLSIRHGLTRTVILVGPYAIKLPRVEASDIPKGSSRRSLTDRWRRFLWGLSANLEEGIAGRRGGPEACPVLLSAAGFLLVAKRAQVCTDEDFPEGEARELLQASRSEGRWVTAELKPENWGWLDGRLVAIDYG